MLEERSCRACVWQSVQCVVGAQLDFVVRAVWTRGRGPWGLRGEATALQTAREWGLGQATTKAGRRWAVVVLM